MPEGPERTFAQEKLKKVTLLLQSGLGKLTNTDASEESQDEISSFFQKVISIKRKGLIL